MNAYIVDGVRTPRGIASKKGSLKDVESIQLLKQLMVAMQDRHNNLVETATECILGCVTQTGEQGGNIAKTAALYSGLQNSLCGSTVNRYCVSGLTSIIYGAMGIMSKTHKVVLGGGVESRSRIPMFSDNGPWYSSPEVMKETKFVNMGISADLLATREGFTKTELDNFSHESHLKAAHATEKGYFRGGIIPIKDKNGNTLLEIDEGISPEKEGIFSASPSFEKLGELFSTIALKQYPEVKRIAHTHTKRSAARMVDGASLTILASEEAIREQNLNAKAEILAFAETSAEPVQMLTAGVTAASVVLKKSGLKPKDIDLYEVNEGFAAVPLHFSKHMGVPTERINVNGGAIAMGHPLGATGSILLNSLVDELGRRNKQYGMVSICGGAGAGAAILVKSTL